MAAVLVSGVSTPLSLLIMMMIETRLATACMSTGSSSQTAVTTTSTCTTTIDQSCRTPSNAIGVIPSSSTNTQLSFNSVPLGSCPCISGLQIGFFSPASSSDPNVVANTAGVISCTNGISNYCECDATGNCYVPFGTIQNAITGVPFCDSQSCSFYAVFICPSGNFNDPNSGLQNTATGAKITCAQTNPSGTATGLVSVGSNSPWPKIVTASCDGCLTCLACSGPFSAIPA